LGGGCPHGGGSGLDRSDQCRELWAVDEIDWLAGREPPGILGEYARSGDDAAFRFAGSHHPEQLPYDADPDLPGLPLFALHEDGVPVLPEKQVYPAVGAAVTGRTGHGVALAAVGLRDERLETCPGERPNGLQTLLTVKKSSLPPLSKCRNGSRDQQNEGD